MIKNKSNQMENKPENQPSHLDDNPSITVKRMADGLAKLTLTRGEEQYEVELFVLDPDDVKMLKAIRDRVRSKLLREYELMPA